jgi:hypothetical protein
MARSSPARMPILVLGATVAALSASPALATEGPPAPPPSGGLPSPLTPVILPGGPTGPIGGPAPHPGARGVIARARLVPRRVRRGQRARLKLTLRAPTRLKVIVTRAAPRHRVKALRVPAGGTSPSVRLPARAGGHLLRSGRYRVTIIAIDASGRRTATVRRTLVVRPARR